MSAHLDALRNAFRRMRQAHRQGQASDWQLLASAAQLHRLEPGAVADEPLPLVRSSELHERGRAALDALLAIDEDSTAEQVTSALEAFDALVAVAALVDREPSVAGPLERAIGLVRAFPEPWAAVAEAASDRLEQLLRHDPAWALWAAVESSSRGFPEEAEQVSAALLETLGLPVVISLASTCGSLRLAAASGLPAESPWSTLAKGPNWELAVTTDLDDRPIVLLVGTTGSFRRDGEELAPNQTPEGLACAASPGHWTVQVEGRDVRFLVRP